MCVEILDKPPTKHKRLTLAKLDSNLGHEAIFHIEHTIPVGVVFSSQIIGKAYKFQIVGKAGRNPSCRNSSPQH